MSEPTPSPEDLVYRLRKRAEIRRGIPTRKSVQAGEPDRLAALLDEAATEIESMANPTKKQAVQELAEAGESVLSSLTDDHEDCHICMRCEDEVTKEGHDPEFSCGELEAKIKEAKKVGAI